MVYIAIAALVFAISFIILYPTRKEFTGKTGEKENLLDKTQSIRGIFAISIFFTVVVMLVIKAIRG